MDTPNWLTKAFLEKLLKENHDSPVDDIEIKSHEVRSALAKGNNFLSNILRISIEYKISSSSGKPNETIQALSLIAKVPLGNGEFTVLSNKTGIVEKEYRVYTELLPKMNGIIKRHNDNTEITPKYFKCDIENILMLEDLQFSGYKMGDRRKQLDYKHSVVVLKCLAKFHAASVKLHESEPEFVERIGIDYVLANIEDDEVRRTVDNAAGEAHLERVCQEFEKRPEMKKYVPFLTKLKPKVLDVLMDSMRLGDDEFAVLNHGDVWTTNFLFKYDDNDLPVKVKFLDFQLMTYSTPVVDLLYFLYTSVRYEVLKTHFQDFVQIYNETLNFNLEKYGSPKRLKLEDLRRSLEKREIYSLIRVVTNLHFQFYDCNELEDDSKISETPELYPLASMIQNEAFISVCAKYLENFSKTSWYQNFK